MDDGISWGLLKGNCNRGALRGKVTVDRRISSYVIALWDVKSDILDRL